MLVSNSDAIELIFDRHPHFHDRLLENASSLEETLFCVEFMGGFATYITELSEAGDEEELSLAARTIEQLIIQGDRYMKDIVSICLLETLTNLLLGRTEAIARRVTERMLPKSVEYCRELDRMWGTKTPGIW